MQLWGGVLRRNLSYLGIVKFWWKRKKGLSEDFRCSNCWNWELNLILKLLILISSCEMLIHGNYLRIISYLKLTLFDSHTKISHIHRNSSSISKWNCFSELFTQKSLFHMLRFSFELSKFLLKLFSTLKRTH